MTHESLARELAEAVNQKDKGWVRRQQYAAIVDFDAALMLSILTKHLAAKEPSNTLPESVLGVLRECHEWISSAEPLLVELKQTTCKKRDEQHARDLCEQWDGLVEGIDQLLGGDDDASV